VAIAAHIFLSTVKVILYQPQIPQNTGNIVRTCSVTGSDLILVEPLGFSISNRWLKRAGLDYWEGVHVEVVNNLEQKLLETSSSFYFFSSKASTPFHSVEYHADDWLIFGSETTGLPSEFFERWPDRFVTIPMMPGKRCLNLATSVGIAVYEAWKQQNFCFNTDMNIDKRR
jgi:tRNA (cytidine/uridine-2'-O-)-methyltransferase